MTRSSTALRDARTSAGLSMEALARLANVSWRTVQRAESRPDRTSRETWVALAGALGLGVDELAHDADATPASSGRAEKHDSPDPRPLAGDVERAGATGG